MAAQSLNCPNCGAAVSSDATRCAHCNSRLATVACPSCFGMIFQGAKFCSHCGAPVSRARVDSDQQRLCPRCRVNLQPVAIGNSHLRECPRCEGLWADVDTLQQIYTDREQQSALLGTAATLHSPQNVPLEKVRYVPCPVCRRLMNRVNFANCSAVIVDVCKPHAPGSTRMNCAASWSSSAPADLTRRGPRKSRNSSGSGGNWNQPAPPPPRGRTASLPPPPPGRPV